MELLTHRAGDVISGNITMDGRADDPNGVTALSWSSDGENFQPLAFKKQRGETAVTFTASVRSRLLEDGPVMYYFRVRDGTGLETTRPYLFFVDNKGP